MGGVRVRPRRGRCARDADTGVHGTAVRTVRQGGPRRSLLPSRGVDPARRLAVSAPVWRASAGGPYRRLGRCVPGTVPAATPERPEDRADGRNGRALPIPDRSDRRRWRWNRVPGHPVRFETGRACRPPFGRTHTHTARRSTTPTVARRSTAPMPGLPFRVRLSSVSVYRPRGRHASVAVSSSESSSASACLSLP